MRELKFRAWDTENKTWTFATLGDLICGACTEIGDKPLSGALQVWEEYTGLKDKNGKEIYEGDVVRTKSPDRANFPAGAIEMVQQMYLIMNAAHYSDPDITHTEPLGYYCDTELEVIGNIHENPELLEKQ